VQAYSATNGTAFALRGAVNTLSSPDLAQGVSLPYGAGTNQLLSSLYQGGNNPSQQAGRAALTVLDSIDRQLVKDASGKPLAYQSAGSRKYDGGGELGRNLASVARLARLSPALSVACADMGGWDTHENQPSRFANQVRQLSAALAAFHEDMAAAHRPVVVLVMTEFGRRVRANKSNGTDHGHGSCWLALGDGIRGGRMLGRWPGLATPQLDQGVDLAVTTDYRQILAEVLRGVGLPNTVEAAAMKTPLGLFASA